MNTFTSAQQDMRQAYYSGAPGALSSGTIWFIAGLCAWLISSKAGVLSLIFGGMLIFPTSIALCKIIGVSGKYNKNNPLAPLALEGTFWMLVSIPIAIGVALYKIEWFFPAMLFVIGGRYLTFSTLYGLRLYWVFALVLIISGWILLGSNAPVFSAAFTGALIEYFFATALFIVHKKHIANETFSEVSSEII